MNIKARFKHSLFSVMLIWGLFFALPLFIAAGTLFWWNAWAFLFVNLISIGFVNWIIYKDTPDLADERAKARENTKPWDKILVPLLVGILPLVSNVLAGLDKRFEWTKSISAGESLLALGVYIFSVVLIAWSMKTNRYFSSHFHIQKERGHVVADSGPYAIVRHPGYLGMLLGALSLSILLGSIASLWIAVFQVCLTILRTALEDNSLKSELGGYDDYSKRVRYRLIPFLW